MSSLEPLLFRITNPDQCSSNLIPTPSLSSFPFPITLKETTSHPPLHGTQMLQHRLIRVQEPLHAILHARLLPPVQLTRRYLPLDALLPTRVCEFVHGWNGKKRKGGKGGVSFSFSNTYNKCIEWDMRKKGGGGEGGFKGAGAHILGSWPFASRC